MRVDLALCNRPVVTAHGVQQVDIGRRGEQIVALTAPGAERLEADERLDLSGLHVFPGGSDPHVHLRDQGLWEFEASAPGTASCAAVGLTSVIDMPLNLPPTIDAASFEARREAVAPK